MASSANVATIPLTGSTSGAQRFVLGGGFTNPRPGTYSIPVTSTTGGGTPIDTATAQLTITGLGTLRNAFCAEVPR